MEDDDDKEEPAPIIAAKPLATTGTQSAIDITAEFLLPLLTPENVANLVHSSFRIILVCWFDSNEIVLIVMTFHVSGSHQHGLLAGQHAGLLSSYLHTCGVGRHRFPNQTSGQTHGHTDDCQWTWTRSLGVFLFLH